MSDETVRQDPAGEVTAAGNLPDRRPERVLGGLGTGASCAVCGGTIGTGEVEIELQFTSGEGSDTAHYHVHALCFTAWERGRRDGGSDGHTSPRRGNRGIIPDRERNTTNQGESGGSETARTL